MELFGDLGKILIQFPKSCRIWNSFRMFYHKRFLSRDVLCSFNTKAALANNTCGLWERKDDDSIEYNVQVLPVIKLSPNYPNGKILLGKWKNGQYKGRFTGLIKKIEKEEIHQIIKMNLKKTEENEYEKMVGLDYIEHVGRSLIPMEIRDFVTDIKLTGILRFDGPPDSIEYICLANVKSLCSTKNIQFTFDYPYELNWFDNNQIPFKNMPEDDQIWYPLLLQEKLFQGYFLFGGNNEHSLKSYELNEVKELKF